MHTVHRSRPYRAFRDHVGNATFHINTAYVALELIARGAAKPSDLVIAWDVPKNPRQAVDQTRSMIHGAMLTRVTDALDAYLTALADESWLDITSDVRNILRKAVTRPGNIAYSIVDRVDALNLRLSIDGRLSRSLVAALVSWRNQAVHEGKATGGEEVRLDKKHEDLLICLSNILGAMYGGFDSAQMFKNMRNRGLPRRKEIVALVAGAQNLVREIDWRILDQTLPDIASLKARAREVILNDLNSRKHFSALWTKPSETRRRKMVSILEQNGFSAAPNAGKPYTPRREAILLRAGLEPYRYTVRRLPEDFLDQIAKLSQPIAAAVLESPDNHTLSQ